MSSQPLPIPSRQFDVGTFEVRTTDRSTSTSTDVGWLYVEAGTGMKIEHWVFVQSYGSPTGDHQVEVQRRSTNTYSSLSAFLSAMAAQQPSNAPYRYARCECVYYDSLPS